MDDRSLGLWESWRRRRDAGAFEALVRPDLGRALGFARSLGCGPEDAEDAVQDALALLAAERGDSPARVGPRAWFFRAVRDRARTATRSGWRRRRRERGASRREAAPAGTEGVAARDEVERALRALDDGDAAAVRLRFLQDLDYGEMAFVLGVSEGACRVRVHRALERLRGSLGTAAPALVASLPLPLPHDAASMVHGALAASAGAGSTAAAAGGVTVMASATKTAAGAAIVLAAGAAGALIATTLGGGPGDGRVVPPGVEPPGAAATWGDGTGGGGTADADARDRGPAGREGLAELEGLGVTAGEARFLRKALVAERERRGAAQLGMDDAALEVLRRYEESGADPAPMLAGFEFVAGRMRAGDGPVARVESTGNPTPVDLATVAKDATVLEFGPGTFLLRDSRAWGRIPGSVEGLEVRGAGMDRTTLVAEMGSLFSVADEAEAGHIRVRDLAWDGGNRGEQILDARGRVAATFERVRFLDWKSAGYSAPVGILGKAVLGFLECEFLGDGGARGGGNAALACRGTVLAVFQDCLFADVSTVIAGWHGAAARSRVSLLGCDFENAALANANMRYQAKPEFPISATGCRVFFGPPEVAEEERRERWGAWYAADLSGTVFSAGKVRCTLGDLAAALEGMRREDGERVLQVSLAGISRSGAPVLDAWSRVRGPDGRGWGPVRWRPLGGVAPTGGAPSTPSLDDPPESGDAPSLDQVVRRSGLPSDRPARTLRYDSASTPDGRIEIVVVEGGEAWSRERTIRLRADTGAPLEE
jgi:RNA polymerase sigma-70 factor (ECF subfamily)